MMEPELILTTKEQADDADADADLNNMITDDGAPPQYSTPHGYFGDADEEAPVADDAVVADGTTNNANANATGTSYDFDEEESCDVGRPHNEPCDPEGMQGVRVSNMAPGGGGASTFSTCDGVISMAAATTGGMKSDESQLGLEAQDTFMSSPTNSDDNTSRPLSRRQQRIKIVKCYGLVALVILVCAIGIPLGAVLLFKNKNDETTFPGAATNANDAVANDYGVYDATAAHDYDATAAHDYDATAASDYGVVAPTTDADDYNDYDVAADVGVVTPTATDAEEEEPVEMDETEKPEPLFTATPEPLSTTAPVTTTEAPVVATNTTNANTTDSEIDATEAAATSEPEEVAVTSEPDEVAVTSEPDEVAVTSEPEEVAATVAPQEVATTVNDEGADRSGVYFTLVNVTSPVILQDDSTPQALAHKWLVATDQVMPIPTGRKLLQRYALVALDHSMHAFGTDSQPVLSQATLDECQWTGVVCNPDTGDVVELRWGRQELKGTLLPELKLMSGLEYLDLSENDLDGTVEALWETKSLKQVHLYRNRFSGPISEQVGLLQELEHLNLGYNQLTGQLPLSLRSPRGMAKPLRFLILHHNKLSGVIPVDWRMRSLFFMDMAYNELTGPLPSDWDLNLKSVRHLYLNNNKLSGTIPSYFGQLGNGRVKSLVMNDNEFTGGIPTNWEPRDQITTMALHNNQLTVPMGPEVCDLSIYESGVLVEQRVDCVICSCDTLCHTCV